jgi:hypothetical protein
MTEYMEDPLGNVYRATRSQADYTYYHGEVVHLRRADGTLATGFDGLLPSDIVRFGLQVVTDPAAIAAAGF